MNVSLTPKLERIVREKVESGMYNNASEVIRQALRQMTASEAENQWLMREAAIGYAQLDAGLTVEVSSLDDLLAVARDGDDS